MAAVRFITKWGSLGDHTVLDDWESRVGGKFAHPQGVAVAPDGSVYVTEGTGGNVDGFNNRIQKFTSDGVFVTKWGTNGSGDGQFIYPLDVAVAADGSVYVADRDNHRIQKFDSSGNFITKWGSYGDGAGQFRNAGGIAFDGPGNVYVVDMGNARVQKFSSDGTFLSMWSTSDEPYACRRIAIAGSGNIYLSCAHYVYPDSFPSIKKFDSTGVFLAQLDSKGSGDGQLSSLNGIALDGLGNLYVADGVADWPGHNDRIQKFSLNE